jgi:hypothetical protein
MKKILIGIIALLMFGGLTVAQDPSGISYLDFEEEEDTSKCVPGTDPTKCLEEPQPQEVTIERPKNCDFDAENSRCRLSLWKGKNKITVNDEEYNIIYKYRWNKDIFYLGNSMHSLEKNGAYHSGEFQIDKRTFEFKQARGWAVIKELK